MNPIHDFQDALKEFKKISSEFVDRGRTLKPGEHRLGRVKKFNNLSEKKIPKRGMHNIIGSGTIQIKMYMNPRNIIPDPRFTRDS